MPNLEAQAAWVPVREIGIELAQGGPNGNMNEQAKALLARTEFLNQQKASKSEIVQGHYEFNTYAEFNAIKSTLPLNCTVIINEMPTGTQTWGQGTNRWNGTTLTKSAYDLLAQANAYTDQAEIDAIAAAASDATTKANAAEANANNYTDTVEQRIIKSQISTLERLPSIVTPLPITPVYDFTAINSDKLGLINNANKNPPTNNVLLFSSGEIRDYSNYKKSTVTRFFADGLVSIGSAAKVDVIAGADNDSTIPFNLVKDLPQGKAYNIRFIARAVEGTTTIYVGSSHLLAGMTEHTLTTTYTTINISIPETGSRTIWIKGNNAAVSFIIDEIQVYEAGDTIPSFADELAAGNRMMPAAIGRSVGVEGLFIKSTVGNYVRSPTFPHAKNWDEITVIVTLAHDNLTGAGNKFVFNTETDSMFGTSSLAFRLGVQATGEAAFAPAIIAGGSLGDISPFGVQVLGIRLGANVNEGKSNLGEVQLSKSAIVRSGFLATTFNLLGVAGNSPYKGRVSSITIFDKVLSDEEYYTAVKNAKDRAALYGETVNKINWLVSEGDSIPANLYSFVRIQINKEHGGKTVKVLSMATGGNPLNTLVGRLPELTKRVNEVKLAGHTPLVSVLIGANDHASLRGTSGYYSPEEYYTRLVSYWDSIRATGAKLIACTILPMGSGSTHAGTNGEFERGRLIVNDLIRSDSSKYDGLADIGAVDTLMGMPDSPNVNPEYWADQVHPNAAGHEELALIFKPVLDNLLK